MAPDPAARLLTGLLPPGVAVAESFGDPAPAELFPEEALAVATAAEKRRREFAAVRGCARTALAELGLPAAAVPADLGAADPWARRAPVWPPGTTGSMTHCDGYRGAAVVRRDVLLAVGVDAEPHAPLPAGVLERIRVDEERAMLADLVADSADVAWDRVLFSAKESVFKAWFPLTQRWLGFEECRVELRPGGEIRAQLLVPGPQLYGGTRLASFAGRWRVLPSHVATVIAVPTGVSAHPSAPL